MNEEIVAKEILAVARDLSASSIVKNVSVDLSLKRGVLVWRRYLHGTKMPLVLYDSVAEDLYKIAKRQVSLMNENLDSRERWMLDSLDEVFLDMKDRCLYIMTNYNASEKAQEVSSRWL